MKRLNKALVLMLCMAVLAMCVLSAGAADFPDLSRKGSVTVTVRETGTGTPVSGGELTLYPVADAAVDDGDFYFAPIAELQDAKLDLSDLDSDTLPQTVAQLVAARSIAGTACKIDAKGQAKFENLSTGLYLVVQTEQSTDHVKLLPFLVTIPVSVNEEYVYDVDATPKAGTVDTKPSEPTKPTTPTTPTKPTTPDKPDIPYTGQLWWPVALMACAGLLLAVLGLKLRKDADRQTAR